MNFKRSYIPSIVIFLLSCMFFTTTNAQALEWNFPLNRTHAGILLGNGIQGLMIWGDTSLNITVGRAGFWDHRGGNDFASRTNYETVVNLVEQKDEVTLKKLFTYVPEVGQPARPQHHGGGLWKISFPKNYRLLKGILNMAEGSITILIETPSRKTIKIPIYQAVFEELTWMDVPKELQGKISSTLIPMWEWNKKELQSRGISPPNQWRGPNINGFVQTLPADLPLAIGQYITPSRLLLSTAVHADSEKEVRSKLQNAEVDIQRSRSLAWWKSYWNEVARVTLPDPELQEIYDYGIYKQACSTPPQGLACTLQGPFMEEYQVPPWSNDYHFNINQQMIYTSALATNRVEHFKPMLDLIETLLPAFRRNGKLFFKNDNAIMFPHAVDDRGQAIGNYWGGTIDHATTAWVAFMTWQYYQYSGDTTYLRKLTYPLLNGAFEGFWSMLEKKPLQGDQYHYSLPLSVSPEYGSGLEGVGRNSSFQLAALHRILLTLPIAANQLQLKKDPRWSDVQDNLPLYSTVNTPYGESSTNNPLRIALWEGKGLEVSHRHHSHLAGIYPFQTFLPSDPVHAKIIEKSYWQWVHMGAGGWTGWCIPWASILHNRIGNTEAAVSWLHYWKRNYVNEGRGTLHNTTNFGLATMNEPIWAKEINKGKRNTEIMQLDAGFGAVSAILDILVQEAPDGIYILRNRHWKWKNLSFERVRTAGGFLVSAVVKEDKLYQVKINSLLGGKITLYHGLGKHYTLNGKHMIGDKLELDLPKGKEFILESP